MKRMFKTLPLLAIAILAVGCNEKISPELNSGASTGGGGTTPPPGESHYFRIVNTSNPGLGHHLHKTGKNNKSTKCEITKQGLGPFSHDDDYMANRAAYDITCFFETEELALYNAGFKFKIEASPNACEFVAYKPYSFYNRMPGDSSATFHVVTCDETVDDTDAAAFASTYGPGSTPGKCGEYIDQTISGGLPVVPEANKLPIRLTSEEEQELCRYDYSQFDEFAENCDIGKIDIIETSITDDQGSTVATTTTRTIECSGAVSSCVKGAIRHTDLSPESTHGILYSEMIQDTAFSLEQSLPGMIEGEIFVDRNIELVNYRRFLASTEIDFWDGSGYITGAFATLSDVDYKHDPDILYMYSNNLNMNGTSIINTSTLRSTVSNLVGYATKPLAAEPALGIPHVHPVTSRYDDGYVHPYYTFECLDSAHEPTARIRMMVRDWDRAFDPTRSYMELLSDFDYGSSARQDSQITIPYDHNYNNKEDWDDLIPMTRTPGSYSPLSTQWRPEYDFFEVHPDYPILLQNNFPGDI